MEVLLVTYWIADVKNWARRCIIRKAASWSNLCAGFWKKTGMAVSQPGIKARTLEKRMHHKELRDESKQEEGLP